MAIGRSTFYDMPDARALDLTIVAEMKTICDEFEAYGYRRVDAELRHRGVGAELDAVGHGPWARCRRSSPRRAPFRLPRA